MYRFWSRLRRDQRGFTLIELAVSVFVISVLIAVALPNLRDAGEKAQKITNGSHRAGKMASTKHNSSGDELPGYFVWQRQGDGS